MFEEIKTLLVERPVECPNCGKALNRGGIMYEDQYRGEIICAYCIDDWKADVIAEEGENGEKLK